MNAFFFIVIQGCLQWAYSNIMHSYIDVHSQFNTPETVLEGTRYMVAMQIAREPLVRHVLRQTFQERAKINIKPTKKGKKVRAFRWHQVSELLSVNKSIDTLWCIIFFNIWDYFLLILKMYAIYDIREMGIIQTSIFFSLTSFLINVNSVR